MPRPDFDALREDLLQTGIAPVHARRVCRELQEHYDDLLGEFRAAGMSRDAAIRRASEALLPLAKMSLHRTSIRSVRLPDFQALTSS